MPRRRRNGTLLSFMRTALTFIGVGVVIVNFLKDFVFVEVAESMRRLREKQKVMKRLSRQTRI